MANYNRTPNTAGRSLTESELRAYLKCPEFYEFGGKYETPVKTRILQRTIEKVLSVSIRKEYSDPTFLLTNTVLEGAQKEGLRNKLMEPQLDQLVNQCVLAASEVMDLLSFERYLPVTGPVPYKVRVSRTPIELTISGTLRSKKNKTLHIVCFTPYTSAHAMRWDITTHLKLNSLQRLVKPHNRRKTDARIHLFGMTDTKLVYTSLDSADISKDLLRRARVLVERIEEGRGLPLVPCPYACPFKQQCQPENA